MCEVLRTFALFVLHYALILNRFAVTKHVQAHAKRLDNARQAVALQEDVLLYEQAYLETKKAARHDAKVDYIRAVQEAERDVARFNAAGAR